MRMAVDGRLHLAQREFQVGLGLPTFQPHFLRVFATLGRIAAVSGIRKKISDL